MSKLNKEFYMAVIAVLLAISSFIKGETDKRSQVDARKTDIVAAKSVQDDHEKRIAVVESKFDNVYVELRDMKQEQKDANKMIYKIAGKMGIGESDK